LWPQILPRATFTTFIAPPGPPPAPPPPRGLNRADAAATTRAVPCIRISGGVKMARILHRVEPVYPPLARHARISGTVELEGIIGTDGRLRELRVISGHPLLVRAAIEAVRQWVYEPTMLSGEPVEVIAPITVSFRMN
jgi:protein TonB